MKKFLNLKSIIVCLIAFAFNFLTAQTVTIASDNFSTNSVSGGTGWNGNWSVTGEVSYTGGRMLMDGGSPFDFATRSVNLTNYTSATLSILGSCEDSSSGWESEDFISVEVSTNGGSSYSTLYTRTGSLICSSADDVETQNISVTLPVGNANTIIRFRSEADSSSEDYYWDNVLVQGISNVDQCDPIASGNTDTDSDGVSDICDEDDDNDGILDENECGIGVQALTAASVQAIPNIGNFSTVVQSTAGGTATFTSSQLHFDDYLDPESGDNFPSNAFVLYDTDDAGLPSAAFTNAQVSWLTNSITFSFPIPVDAFQITGFDFDGAGNEVIENLSVQPTSVSANTVIIGSGSGSSYESNASNQTIVLDFDLATPVTQITFDVTRPSAGFTSAFTVAFDGCLADTDFDGVFDYLDTDSDGDGCNDVLESGGVDNNNDGVLDGTGINSGTGRVTGGTGGYDGAGTSFNTANQLVVTSNPLDVTASSGDPSATFTVGARVDAATSYSGGTPTYGALGNANGTRQYQWYDGDPDNGGTALANSNPSYSGVTTATLTVSNPFSSAPKTFYVVVTSSSLSTECSREVRSAQMDPDDPCIPGPGNPDTDGDSVADVCDVDDDNDGILDVDETNN